MEQARNRAERLRRYLGAAASGLLAAPIHVYRLGISPLLPPSCRFQPTCSCYALEALAVHGPLKGTWLTLKRLGRCHPFTRFGGASGYDPVPPPGHGPARGLRPPRPF